jgi:transglutaminase-like putative cysteine protease
LTTRKGDCGIQSMLFITMCRAAGVPARWQSGWETKPVNWNMHDWAEFYVEPWGWLPADVSYGLQKSDDPRIREFYFGHQDSYRMAVNFDYGCAFTPDTRTLRSEPADFQRGEVEIDGRNLYFNEWDYDFSFES